MSIINQSTATALEVNRVCDAISHVIEGEEEGLALMSLLSLILVIQHPQISHEELLQGVKEISQHIALWIGTTDTAKAMMEPETIH